MKRLGTVRRICSPSMELIRIGHIQVSKFCWLTFSLIILTVFSQSMSKFHNLVHSFIHTCGQHPMTYNLLPIEEQ